MPGVSGGCSCSYLKIASARRGARIPTYAPAGLAMMSPLPSAPRTKGSFRFCSLRRCLARSALPPAIAAGLSARQHSLHSHAAHVFGFVLSALTARNSPLGVVLESLTICNFSAGRCSSLYFRPRPRLAFVAHCGGRDLVRFAERPFAALCAALARLIAAFFMPSAAGNTSQVRCPRCLAVTVTLSHGSDNSFAPLVHPGSCRTVSPVNRR